MALNLIRMIVAVCLLCPCAVMAQEKLELGEKGFERIEAPDPATPEGEVWIIRKNIAESRPKEAVRLADRWVKDHPNHPMIAEVYLLRGDAHSTAGDHYKALFDYEQVIRVYPDTPQFETAMRRELIIAQMFSRGVKRKFLGLRFVPTDGEAEELFIRIQERAPGSAIAEEAGIELGDHYYRRQEMRRAAEAYDLFLENYPRSQWREYAMHRQIQSNLATFKGPRFDATGLIDAQSRLGDYKQQFPAAAEQIGAEALLTRIEESLAERAFVSAEWYDTQKNIVSARFMYKRLISDYPNTEAARRALDRLRVLEPALFDAPTPSDSPAPAATSEPAEPRTPAPTDAPAPEGPPAQPTEPAAPEPAP